MEAKKHRWKYDILLLAVLAVAAGGIFLFYRGRTAQQEQPEHGGEPVYYVQVEVNSRPEQLILLTEDGDYTFDNIYSKGENIIHIENGGVSMQSATCPDQVCVYQGIIEPPTAIPIVCMPNVVYVSLVERSEIDWSRFREEVVPEELSADYATWQAAQE